MDQPKVAGAHHPALLPEWPDLDAAADYYAVRRSSLYRRELGRALRFLVPPGASVLEVGCGNGDLIASLSPSVGVGIDLSSKAVEIARARHPGIEFLRADAYDLPRDRKFDYIVLADLIGEVDDVQRLLTGLRPLMYRRTRVVATWFNHLWEPLIKLAEVLRIKPPQRTQNWLTVADVENLLYLSGLEQVKRFQHLLVPLPFPLLAVCANRFLSRLPLLSRLCLIQVAVARPLPGPSAEEADVSVIVPARNERGNIAGALARTPLLGRSTELIFVEGNSSDGTEEEIVKRIAEYRGPLAPSLVRQGNGRGKGDAVRKGFAAAKGDVLMILDADLTMPPEELPKFYDALVSGKGDFINGCRLVYPMEEQAMRSLNLAGNKAFSILFTYLLDQRFKDTLCGTKVLWSEDYRAIAANRAFFGDFDPFGDFDLLFGASKMNLKMVELPIRYRERLYGTTNISRFRHGWILLRMCGFAFRKLKLL